MPHVRSEELPSSLSARLPTVSEMQESIKEKQREIAQLKKIIAKRLAKPDPLQIRMFD